MVKLLFKTSFLTTALLLALGQEVSATTYSLPASGDKLVGNPKKITYVKAKKNETLLNVARRYDLGQNQIVKANKDVDRWLPSKPVGKTRTDKEGNQFLKVGQGKDIHIPNTYLLPKGTRNGIVLNLPEYRLYYYKNGGVITHPISIGRVDWTTPLGKTSIVSKTKNPTWTPPASIRREHAAKGDILPAVFPAGPDNPLGLFKMRLGRAGYLIHSTNKPLGVGMRVSHGCVRMYPEDIERIFPSVAVGTAVYIVNEPIKVGWSNGKLYVEAHPDLEDNQHSFQQRLDLALNLIDQAKGDSVINISGAKLRKALQENNGIPVAVYTETGAESAPTIVRVPASGQPKAKPVAVKSTAAKKLKPPVLNDTKPKVAPPVAVKKAVVAPKKVTKLPPLPRLDSAPPPAAKVKPRPIAKPKPVAKPRPVSAPKLAPPKLKPPKLELNKSSSEPEYTILKSAVPPSNY